MIGITARIEKRGAADEGAPAAPNIFVRAWPRLLRLAVATCAIAALAVAAFQTRLGFSAYRVTSSSMEPTLHCAGAPGCRSLRPDRVLANRWVYMFQPVNRGDVVILQRHGQGCGHDQTLIKRIVATPGDLVERFGKIVYVNGKVANHGMANSPGGDLVKIGRSGRARRLASTQYYVLGDAGISCDSRTFGPVARSEIIAKGVLRYASLGRISPL